MKRFSGLRKIKSRIGSDMIINLEAKMKRTTLFIRFISILLLFPLSGCISIIQGSEQKVSFSSKPEGAIFNYYGKQCKAPCELILPRVGNRSSMLSIEHDGFSPYSVDILPKPISPAFVPIIILESALLLPLIIDISSGNMYDFPVEIHANYKTPLMAPIVDLKWKE